MIAKNSEFIYIKTTISIQNSAVNSEFTCKVTLNQFYENRVTQFLWILQELGVRGKLPKKLIDYLPNAVSFIFVINVGSAGGMQNDRVSMLYQPNYMCHF